MKNQAEIVVLNEPRAMYEVSEDVKTKVYETFGRNERMVEDDVRIIKTWMTTQPHLPEIMEEVKIRNFLNLNKYSIEKTKTRIDMYYTIRNIIPEIFDTKKLRPESIKNLFSATYLFTFPKPLYGTHRIYFSRQKKPNIFNVIDVLNAWFAIFEIRLYEDFMVDDYILVDMDNYSFDDLKTITPSLLTKCLAVYKKVYALRFKKIIYFNCPTYISFFVALLKSVMKPKIFSRLEFHQDAEIIKGILPKEELPKEYGGEGPSLEEYNEMMEKKFYQYENIFDRLDKLRVNEELRPEKLNNDEVLGFYGSFKKIDID